MKINNKNEADIYFYYKTNKGYKHTTVYQDYLDDVQKGEASGFYPPRLFTPTRFREWLDETFGYNK